MRRLISCSLTCLLLLTGCGAGSSGPQGPTVPRESVVGGNERTGVCDTGGECMKRRPDGSVCRWGNDRLADGESITDAELRACGYLGPR